MLNFIEQPGPDETKSKKFANEQKSFRAFLLINNSQSANLPSKQEAWRWSDPTHNFPFAEGVGLVQVRVIFLLKEQGPNFVHSLQPPSICYNHKYIF